MKIRIALIVLLAACGVVLAGCQQITAVAGVESQPTAVLPLVTENGAVIAEGNIVPRDYSNIILRSGGKIAEVLVKEGDVVEADAVLLRLGDREQAEAALAAAKLEQESAQQAVDDLNEQVLKASSLAQQELTAASNALIEARQRRDDLDTDEYQADLDDARAKVISAQDELEDAQEEWDKYKDMDPDNANYKRAEDRLEDAQRAYNDAVRERDRLINQMEEANAEVAAAEARFEDAKREWEKRKDGKPAADEMALAKLRLDNAIAQTAAAEAALKNLEVRAPFAGTIVELNAAAGEVIPANQQVILLADLSELYVETTDLTERDVVKLSEGQAAIVMPDALPDLSMTGEVVKIARSSGKKGGDVIYTVRIKLDDPDPRLRWGMTVEVRFEK